MSDEDKKNNWFLWLIGVSCLVVILVSFCSFYFKKNYNFIVETACDTSKEECFQRDCANPDDCPPNGLSDFKRFSLKASDFQYCQNEDCTMICENRAIKCAPVKCVQDLEAGESCSLTAVEKN